MAKNCLHTVSLWELSQTLWKVYISLPSLRSGSFNVCRCGQHFVNCTSNLAGHFNYINVSVFLYTSLQIAFIISASFVPFLLHLAFSLERQNTFLFSPTLWISTLGCPLLPQQKQTLQLLNSFTLPWKTVEDHPQHHFSIDAVHMMGCGWIWFNGTIHVLLVDKLVAMCHITPSLHQQTCGNHRAKYRSR